MKLESLGIPTVLLVSDQFDQLAHLQAESLGMGAIARAVFPHPLGGVPPEEVLAKAEGLFGEVERLATTPGGLLAAEHYADCPTSGVPEAGGGRVVVAGSHEGMAEYLDGAGLGDDLPVVPPTESRVAEMLRWSDRDPGEVIGLVYPNGAPATVEKVAANAVMAGCRPHYFPLVVAAVQAITRPDFNLLGLQATTHPIAPLLVFNGPLGKEAGIHSGSGLFGPGCHANTTIGRAVRLVMLNIGGGVAGTGDKATHGQPGKYTYCIAENEAVSPWPARHVEEGYPADASTITVVPGEAPHNIHDSWSGSAESLLDIIVRSITQMGSNNAYGMDPDMLLILGPEHADLLARDGYDKPGIRQHVYEHARFRLSEWPVDFVTKGFASRFPALYRDVDPEITPVPMIRAPERLLIIVAGGAGKHSMHVPTFGTPSIIEPVTLKTGEYAKSLADFLQ